MSLMLKNNKFQNLYLGSGQPHILLSSPSVGSYLSSTYLFSLVSMPSWRPKSYHTMGRDPCSTQKHTKEKLPQNTNASHTLILFLSFDVLRNLYYVIIDSYQFLHKTQFRILYIVYINDNCREWYKKLITEFFASGVPMIAVEDNTSTFFISTYLKFLEILLY